MFLVEGESPEGKLVSNASVKEPALAVFCLHLLEDGDGKIILVDGAVFKSNDQHLYRLDIANC